MEVRVNGKVKFPFLPGNSHGKSCENAKLVKDVLYDAIKRTNVAIFRRNLNS